MVVFPDCAGGRGRPLGIHRLAVEQILQMVGGHHEIRRDARKNLNHVAIHRAQLHHGHSRFAIANEEHLRRIGARIGEYSCTGQKDSHAAAVQQNARRAEHAGLQRQVLVRKSCFHRNGARV